MCVGVRARLCAHVCSCLCTPLCAEVRTTQGVGLPPCLRQGLLLLTAAEHGQAACELLGVLSPVLSHFLSQSTGVTDIQLSLALMCVLGIQTQVLTFGWPVLYPQNHPRPPSPSLNALFFFFGFTLSSQFQKRLEVFTKLFFVVITDSQKGKKKII